MRVRMKVYIGGFRDLEPWPAAGGEIDVTEQEAADLVVAGYAEIVDDQPEEAPDATPSEDDRSPAPAGEPAPDSDEAPGTDEPDAQDDGEPAPDSDGIDPATAPVRKTGRARR